MKKTLLFGALMCASFMGFSQSQRTVFIEEFTQASCPPCETTTPALNAIIEANAEKIVQLRYQTSWPGTDPMNVDNPTEVQTRVDYYGVTGVPDVFADGTTTGNPGTLPQATIDGRYGITAPVLVEVEHSIASDLSSIDVTVKITNEGTDAYSVASNRLRVALVEEIVSWPNRPGSTSLVDFEAVMKTFFTGTAGMELPEIAAGETWEMSWTELAIPGNVYNFGELAVVAFVQDDATKAAVNGGYSEPLLLDYVDLSVVYAELVDNGGLCDDFSAKVEVENRGGADAATFTVDMISNGVTVATETVDMLASVSSTEVDFGLQSIEGSAVITFTVNTDVQELGSLNDSSRAGVIGRVLSPAGSVTQDYEADDVGLFPNNVVVNLPAISLNGIVVDGPGLNVTQAMGGYGLSDKCIMVNFWNWNPTTVGVSNGEIVIAEQFNVPADGNLSFDYAYTSYSGSLDRLQVQVSTDCGDSYSDIFNKAGAELRTAAEVNMNNLYFTPAADDWATENLDLSAYAGQDVIVRMFVTSAWGDMLYFDNIQMNSPVDVNELNDNESLLVFPNPASQNMNIELSIEESANVSVRMIDMLGRTILTEQIGTNVKGALSHTLDVNNINSGAYLLFFQIDERQVVQRVNISH